MEENTIEVVEVEKEGFMAKVKTGIKKNGKKIAKIAVGVLIGLAAGAVLIAKKKSDSSEEEFVELSDTEETEEEV